jgi:hypothetical protein
MAEREYTVVAPDGKEITLIGPVGASQQDVIAQAQRLYKPTQSPMDRGNIINTDVPTVVGTRPNAVNQQPVQAPRTMGDYAKALYEVPLAAFSSFPAAVAYGNVPSGSAPEVYQAAEERAARLQYSPKSPVSQDVLQSVGEVLTDAKIPPFIPVLGTTARATQQAGRTTAPLASSNLPSFNQVTQAVKNAPARYADLLREREAPVMSGVGAAEVPAANQRIQLAQGLRVPINLRKGQATKELGQAQFEAEMAKTYPKDVGRPIIESNLTQNERVLQNFDAYVDATGAQKAGELNLREVGKVVDSALVNEANRVKKKITDLYTIAREKGETQEPVSYAPLKAYIEQQTPTVRTKLAPILDAVDEQIKLNDPKGTGAISINQIEDIFQFINKNYDPTDAVANVHVRQMKNFIDASTEGKGGEYYQTARAMRAKYAREFENVGYIDKLLSKKSGTTDRAVALEDVFDHSILKGSLDDVRSIGRTLKKAGPEGEQAWRELQGQTIEQMKAAVTKNIQRDEVGNPIVSPKQFDTFVKNLDSDGKLDYIFGKKGAQEIRDLRDTAITVYSPVAGINQSNTASALTQALDRIRGSALSKLPMGIGSLYEVGAEMATKKKLGKQVQETVDFDPNALSKELRKGK